MGYDWLGRMPYKGSVENGAYKAQGVQLTAKLGYPITDDLDIYTRLGGMVWRADTKSNVYGKNHDTGVSPVFAGGVEYAITPEIATVWNTSGPTTSVTHTPSALVRTTAC